MKKWTSKLNWKPLLLGIAVGLLTMVMLCAIGAALMTGKVVGMETMSLWAAGILAAGGLLGTLAAHLAGGGNAEEVLTAVGETVVLLAMNLLLNGGTVEGILPTMLAISGGCGAGVLLTRGKGRGRPRRRRR